MIVKKQCQCIQGGGPSIWAGNAFSALGIGAVTSPPWIQGGFPRTQRCTRAMESLWLAPWQTRRWCVRISWRHRRHGAWYQLQGRGSTVASEAPFAELNRARLPTPELFLLRWAPSAYEAWKNPFPWWNGDRCEAKAHCRTITSSCIFKSEFGWPDWISSWLTELFSLRNLLKS